MTPVPSRVQFTPSNVVRLPSRIVPWFVARSAPPLPKMLVSPDRSIMLPASLEAKLMFGVLPSLMAVRPGIDIVPLADAMTFRPASNSPDV